MFATETRPHNKLLSMTVHFLLPPPPLSRGQWLSPPLLESSSNGVKVHRLLDDLVVFGKLFLEHCMVFGTARHRPVLLFLTGFAHTLAGLLAAAAAVSCDPQDLWVGEVLYAVRVERS